jgi:hypothetical protein
MKRSSLEIYSLAVCFVFVVLIAIATAMSISSLVMYTFPQYTINSYVAKRHSNNNTFYESIEDKQKQRPPEVELNKLREESYKTALLVESTTARNEFTIIFISDLVFIGVFIIHWLLGKKARQKQYSI